ncbi:MAG: fused MFS/spermidine synthase [Candidatus Pacebacteria bacterium]|nr:fused MFS/spermidine synthase [Candidatus Paceibacterota bacterium]
MIRLNNIRFLLFSTVFLTGAAVLIFEVTAVRALSPYFGTSIYVISSVLTTILAALSLGYYFGGRLADKIPDVRVLYLVIGFAGLLMNLLYLTSIFFFPYANQLFPITYGPLVLSLFFYFTPAFLLGIDSPFVIKLLTKTGDDSHNGAVVGSVFFWSTVGSIVGSLASGFWLIPFIGVQQTFVITATTVSIFACVAYLLLLSHTRNASSKLSINWTLSITIISVFIAATILRTETPNPDPAKLLYQDDGYYSQIEVREQRHGLMTLRSLRREVNHSSAIILGTTRFALMYPEYARAYQYLQTNTKDFLLLGGGAYTIPRTLLIEDERLHFDVVEIEPSLYTLAQTYFELPNTPRLHNFPTDARTFLHSTDKRYDVIYIDIFQSGHFIPPHLSTKEFFKDVYDHLNPKGVLVINLIGISDLREKNLTGSLIKTIETAFPELQLYSASNHNDNLQNFAVIAQKDVSEFTFSEAFIIDRKDGTFIPAKDLYIDKDRFYLDEQMVLTDDLAPVELLVAKQILSYQ